MTPAIPDLGWFLVYLGSLCIVIEIFLYVKTTLPIRKKFAPQKTLKKPVTGTSSTAAAGTEPPDLTKDSQVLIDLIKKLPWPALVGLILIYFGLLAHGIEFPFKVTLGT